MTRHGMRSRKRRTVARLLRKAWIWARFRYREYRYFNDDETI